MQQPVISLKVTSTAATESTLRHTIKGSSPLYSWHRGWSTQATSSPAPAEGDWSLSPSAQARKKGGCQQPLQPMQPRSTPSCLSLQVFIYMYVWIQDCSPFKKLLKSLKNRKSLGTQESSTIWVDAYKTVPQGTRKTWQQNVMSTETEFPNKSELISYCIQVNMVDFGCNPRDTFPMLHHDSFAYLSGAFCRCQSASGQDQQFPVHMLSLQRPPSCKMACLRYGRSPHCWYFANYVK